MSDSQVTTRVSDDGLHLIIVERWFDTQMLPARWRSKNYRRKLKPNEVAYYQWKAEQDDQAGEELAS